MYINICQLQAKYLIYFCTKIFSWIIKRELWKMFRTNILSQLKKKSSKTFLRVKPGYVSFSYIIYP